VIFFARFADARDSYKKLGRHRDRALEPILGDRFARDCFSRPSPHLAPHCVAELWAWSATGAPTNIAKRPGCARGRRVVVSTAEDTCNARYCRVCVGWRVRWRTVLPRRLHTAYSVLHRCADYYRGAGGDGFTCWGPDARRGLSRQGFPRSVAGNAKRRLAACAAFGEAEISSGRPTAAAYELTRIRTARESLDPRPMAFYARVSAGPRAGNDGGRT